MLSAFQKMLTKKCSHHFTKNVDEKISTTIQKIIMKKIKKSKRVGIGGFESAE
jgi:hypothetical protein